MANEKTIKLYKEKGETPLQRLERFREENPEYGEVKLSYAGRLDPMAEGVLFVLIGDENKEREKHLKYSKEYTFEVLFGFKTDSYDLLGMIQDGFKPLIHSENDIEKVLEEFKGNLMQEYPPYSSKPVKGKPLFEWAQKGKLSEIRIPKHSVTIYNIKLLGLRTISVEELRKYIIENVMRVRGNFRQKEILNKWGEELDKINDAKLQIAEINTYCSAGTYVRALTNDMGKKLGNGALAFSIKREDIINKPISQ